MLTLLWLAHERRVGGGGFERRAAFLFRPSAWSVDSYRPRGAVASLPGTDGVLAKVYGGGDGAWCDVSERLAIRGNPEEKWNDGW